MWSLYGNQGNTKGQSEPPEKYQMGRLESLTAWALGRTPYEDEVIFGEPGEGSRSTQQYNEHGHPRNPETKRREREHVRAANEVMQVTGVVEDSIAAKSRAKAYRLQKNQETYTGLRLMEAGRAVLVGGVWGVLGLRRRVLVGPRSILCCIILTCQSYTSHMQTWASLR